jgi:hypothetical protein
MLTGNQNNSETIEVEVVDDSKPVGSSEENLLKRATEMKVYKEYLDLGVITQEQYNLKLEEVNRKYPNIK